MTRARSDSSAQFITVNSASRRVSIVPSIARRVSPMPGIHFVIARKPSPNLMMNPITCLVKLAMVFFVISTILSQFFQTAIPMTMAAVTGPRAMPMATTAIFTFVLISSHFFQTIMVAVTIAAIAMIAKVIGPIATERVPNATLSNPTEATIVGRSNSNGPMTNNNAPNAATTIPRTLARFGCASAQSIIFLTNSSIFGTNFSMTGSNASPNTCIRSPNRFFN